MAKVIFRLPSKAVRYGYVEVEGTPEEFGLDSLADASVLGMVYEAYARAFHEGEAGASGKPLGTPVPSDLGDFEGQAQAAPAEPGESDTEASAVALIESTLGATVVSEEPAPWSKPPGKPKTKVWEAAPAADLGDDW